MNAQDIQRLVADSVELKQRFFSESASLLLEVGGLMAESLRAGGRLLAFGNGGSASDAQHFAAELVGRLKRERRGLSAIALTTDPSMVTAVANDMGFEAVFRRQVEAPAGRATWRSGSAPPAARRTWSRLCAARARAGCVTVGLTGDGGGELAGLVDWLIAVPHPDTDAHAGSPPMVHPRALRR